MLNIVISLIYNERVSDFTDLLKSVCKMHLVGRWYQNRPGPEEEVIGLDEVHGLLDQIL